MNTINVPIHSTKTLIKASLIASVIAGLLLITCILPSEYNIDPTGRLFDPRRIVLTPGTFFPKWPGVGKGIFSARRTLYELR